MSLNPECIEIIRAEHFRLNGNLKKMSEALPYSKSAIKKYCEELGLKLSYKKCTRLTEYLKERIKEQYVGCNGVLSEMSKNLNISPKTLREYSMVLGLELNKIKGLRADGKYGGACTYQQREYILKLYDRYGGNVAQAARAIGRSKELISKVWREDNIESRV
ncbi:hypothetical protein J4406_03040 [Candidatus Woesearchaeota archaeon]|nr:hypothetical protein [Candidatus Woesearchaeota archaeon]